MENKRGRKTFLFLCILFLVCVAIFFLYYAITDKKNPLLNFINNVIDNKEGKLNDNYNGIYTYYDELNGSKYIYTGCSLSKIANYILIIDDEYHTFRSSCMGTYAKDSGKTADLDIRVDDVNKNYYIYYDDKVYDKDNLINKIVVNNNISNITQVDLSTYELFMKETQFPGNYYELKNLKISNISSNLELNILKNNDQGSFKLSIGSPRTNTIYKSIDVTDFDFLPQMYPFGSSVIVIEKAMNDIYEGRYKDSINVITERGITYNLADKFPIVIDGVTLNTDNSIFIKFDPAKRYFRLLVGYDDKFCSETFNDSDKDNIMYYEFTLDYNYEINNLNEPKFVKIGRKSEGCRYVNSLMGD